MKSFEELKRFYEEKRVLLTGHTGFKGSTMTVLLSLLGAECFGYGLKAPTEPSLFEILYGKDASRESRKNLKAITGPEDGTKAEIRLRESCIGDIRNFEAVRDYVNYVKPDIVIHMAAQPIVRESYRIPRETFETNVMGTVNLLEAVRLYTQQPEQKKREEYSRGTAGYGPAAEAGKIQRISLLNITTDKVYRNEEKSGYAYREEDQLDGYDPYSNSKSCSELVTHSYQSAFFLENKDNLLQKVWKEQKQEGSQIVRISTARAGNVIGGGDFAADRLIPDCMRAELSGSVLAVRNPYSTRPFQHVLEPLFAYLTIAMEQYTDEAKQGCYNVGPDLEDCVTAGQLCDLYAGCSPGFTWRNQAETDAPHEAEFLRLDNTKLKETFGWAPRWHIADAVQASADWCRAYRRGNEAANRELLRQIGAYVNSSFDTPGGSRGQLSAAGIQRKGSYV